MRILSRYLLPAVLTLGCSVAAGAEGVFTIPGSLLSPASGTAKASPLDAPADVRVTLPKLAPRLLPAIFEQLKNALIEQSEPTRMLGVEKGAKLTEDEREQFEEARGHVTEAVAAMQELFLAQMALVRAPLEHPGCAMEAQEREKVLAACEAYLAENFRRDVEALRTASDGAWDGLRVAPGTHPGNQVMLHLSELDGLVWSEDRSLSANEDYLQRLNILMERQLAKYEPSEDDGCLILDPFCPMGDSKNVVRWPNGVNPAAGPDVVDYGAAMRELIRREHRSWQRYYEAMDELVGPCSGFRGSITRVLRYAYDADLLQSRERFVYMLLAGAANADSLAMRPREKEAELRPLCAQHDFGEIFSETATLFRHPGLEGKPWCIRFHYTQPGFIFVADGKALQQYATAHPNGGEAKVRGYQTIEVVGAPYEAPQQDGEYEADTPAPKPRGGLEPRQVFQLLECKDAPEAGGL